MVFSRESINSSNANTERGKAVKSAALISVVLLFAAFMFAAVPDSGHDGDTTLAAGSEYMMTGNVSASYTATKNGSPFISVPDGVQNVLEAIRDDAAGNDCTIIFNKGSSAYMQIGFSNLIFSGTWGEVTLKGDLQSGYTGLVTGTGAITVNDDVSVNINANIRGYNSASTATVVQFNSSGTLNITGGNINATNNYTGITANGAGTVIVSGGTVSSVNANAVIVNDVPGTDAAFRMTGGTVSITGPSAAMVTHSPREVVLSDGTVTAAAKSVAMESDITIGAVFAEFGIIITVGTDDGSTLEYRLDAFYESDPWSTPIKAEEGVFVILDASYGSALELRAATDDEHEIQWDDGSMTKVVAPMYSKAVYGDMMITMSIVTISDDDEEGPDNTWVLPLMFLLLMLLIFVMMLAGRRSGVIGFVRCGREGVGGVTVAYAADGDISSVVTDANGKFRIKVPQGTQVTIKSATKDGYAVDGSLPGPVVSGKESAETEVLMTKNE